MGQIFAPWWNNLPIVPAIADGLGPTHAIAGVWCSFSPWYTDVGYRPVPYRHKLHVGELGLDGERVLFPRGAVPAASFHQDRILTYPDGQIFDVITNGTGLMSRDRWPIPPEDRRAIVACVRELERTPAGID